MNLLYLLTLGLLLVLYAPIASLAYERGRARSTTVDYFRPQPVVAHPDAALIAENEALRERVAELEAQVVWEARTYLELIAERLELRHKLAEAHRLRLKWHRLYRGYRRKYLQWSSRPQGYGVSLA